MINVYKPKKDIEMILCIVVIVGMFDCSLRPKEGETTSEAVDESKTTVEESVEPSGEEVIESNEKEVADAAGISQGDPIVARVDRYEDNTIVLRDLDDDDIIYYFSTQYAEVIEGDSPIAAGDIVEITYRGVQGDEEHPGEAVKIVAESMIYKQVWEER